VTGAAFLDRDGVINQMVYYPEHGIVDSPFTFKQFNLMPGVGYSLRRLERLGYKLIVISNQPGIAKGHFTEETFEKISHKMRMELEKYDVKLDGEYYCLHHPSAKRLVYRLNCECRKPKPGLILKAAKEHNIDLAGSLMIGDGLVDVKAGKLVGCTTILIGSVNSLLTRLMKDLDAEPDFVVHSIDEVANLVERLKIPRERDHQKHAVQVRLC